ncbi:hypothetical protein TNCV_514821 [Trichonephila clavipes]|nr:hypothetical protein TNCV_514821 [Trichonephila clavipes]
MDLQLMDAGGNDCNSLIEPLYKALTGIRTRITENVCRTTIVTSQEADKKAQNTEQGKRIHNALQSTTWLREHGSGTDSSDEDGRKKEKRRIDVISKLRNSGLATATAGSDGVQSGCPIFDDFFQHLWPCIGNNTANVVFQMVKRLWLICIDQ